MGHRVRGRRGRARRAARSARCGRTNRTCVAAGVVRGERPRRPLGPGRPALRPSGWPASPMCPWLPRSRTSTRRPPRQLLESVSGAQGPMLTLVELHRARAGSPGSPRWSPSRPDRSGGRSVNAASAEDRSRLERSATRSGRGPVMVPADVRIGRRTVAAANPVADRDERWGRSRRPRPRTRCPTAARGRTAMPGRSAPAPSPVGGFDSRSAPRPECGVRRLPA
jgi:hypothetical protein